MRKKLLRCFKNLPEDDKEMNKVMRIILLILTLLPTFVFGDGQDSLGGQRNGFLMLPILFYTPETKLAGGAAMNYYFHERGSSDAGRPSTIMPSLIYTQQKQIMSEISADLYWRNGDYHLLGYVNYKKFPDKFYGIGANTPQSNEEKYTPLSAIVRTSLQHRIRSGLYVGIHYEFEHHKLIKVEANGLLAQREILGSRGGTVSGVGLLINGDTRDNIFYPMSGTYWQLTATLFNRTLASDYDFKRYNLDFRQYLPLSSSGVIAFQAYMNVMTGAPPFQKLSMLAGRIGSSNLMRGYYEGRYRDKQMLAFQLEYRMMPLWRRLGLAAFAGWGDVSDRMKSFRLRKFKYSIGGSIRFLISRQEKLNLRLDFAYGKNASGMYITIGEAF